MTRYNFGGDEDAFVSDDLGNRKPGLSGTFWTAQTGGTQHTDVIDANGGTAGAIRSASSPRGQVQFQGPDGIDQGWLDFGNGRVLMRASDAFPVASEFAASLALKLDVATAAGTYASIAQVFDVHAYGAVGDGATDDTAAWTAALVAAPAGSTVVGRAGKTYVVNSPITPPTDNVTIDLRRAAIRIGLARAGETASNDKIFYLNGRTGVRVINARFLAPLSVFAGGGDRGWVYLNNTVDCGVRDCSFAMDATGGNAVMVKGDTAVGNAVTDNLVTGGGITYAYAGASATLCARNRIENSGTGANALSGTGNGTGYNEDCRVLDNRIVNPGRMGIEDQQKTRGTIIRGNAVTGAVTFGISSVGVGALIEGNTIVDAAGSYAIEAGGHGTRVASNRIRWTSAGTTGIAVNSSSTDGHYGTTVVGNWISRPSVGIALIGTASVVAITGNTILDWTSRGIEAVNTAEAVTITGNVLRQSVPNNTGSNRYGIHPNCPGATVVGNQIFVTAAAGGGTNGDYTIKLPSSANVTVAFNTIDGGSVTVPFKPIVNSNGASADGLRYIGNVIKGGAEQTLSNVTNAFTFANTGTFVANGTLVGGFYNTTPIARPGSTPAAATDPATTMALVNDLRTKLLALGLIA